MGDLLGSPRVASLFLWYFSIVSGNLMFFLLITCYMPWTFRREHCPPWRNNKQYYGNTWSASGSVRAWTWCRENVALEENNLDHIGCDHTSTKAPDPIRTPKLSVLGRE